MIRTEHIHKSFGKLTVLRDVNVRLERGRAVAVIGPNGSGKTTLIKILLGLVIPDAGTVYFDNQPVQGAYQYRTQIGYMPQIGHYPANLKIRQLFEMMKDLRKGNSNTLDEDLLDTFGLRAMFDKALGTLSGGTKQKVSAALAFLFDPPVLILDEPTAGLDPLASELLKEKIQREHAKGKLILITSHVMADLDDLEKTMNKITKYVLYDIVRNRFVLGYTALLLAITLSFFGFESDSNKGLLSLLNIILMVVPLVSIIFSTIHFYNSYEFIELLLAQPLSRQRIFLSEYAGVAASLSLAFLVGLGVPTVLFDGSQRGAVLIISGLLLTLTFVSLAFLAAVVTRDKAKGIGLALVLWFYFALVYDGLVLGILFSFSDYPLEKPMLLLTALNPTDLARVMVLMKMDISALMGFTGAVFQDFFSTQYGLLVALAVLLVWVAWPVAVATRIFSKKDLYPSPVRRGTMYCPLLLAGEGMGMRLATKIVRVP